MLPSSAELCLLFLVAYLVTIRPWRWRYKLPPKGQLAYTRQSGVTHRKLYPWEKLFTYGQIQIELESWKKFALQRNQIRCIHKKCYIFSHMKCFIWINLHYFSSFIQNLIFELILKSNKIEVKHALKIY